MIGHILGVKVGQTFPDRRALHDANVHRGLMAGQQEARSLHRPLFIGKMYS